MEKLIEKAVSLVEKAEKILIFTGAGISTESGIPDFRSIGGIWDKYDPEDFYFQKFISSEKSREKYWKMSTEYYEVMKGASPNRAHTAVKDLEDMGKLLAIVTQNIDRLHHRAGNTPEKIIELHGTAFIVTCLKCGQIYERDRIEERIKGGVKVPYCDLCSGIIKPATISFGQSMPEKETALAMEYSLQCDLCVVLGSSLMVYPAASIPEQAKSNGASLFIINRDGTPLDQRADLIIHDSAAKTMEKIINGLKGLV